MLRFSLKTDHGVYNSTYFVVLTFSPFKSADVIKNVPASMGENGVELMSVVSSNTKMRWVIISRQLDVTYESFFYIIFCCLY